MVGTVLWLADGQKHERFVKVRTAPEDLSPSGVLVDAPQVERESNHEAQAMMDCTAIPLPRNGAPSCVRMVLKLGELCPNESVVQHAAPVTLRSSGPAVIGESRRLRAWRRVCCRVRGGVSTPI
jgi:hypothetical protein